MTVARVRRSNHRTGSPESPPNRPAITSAALVPRTTRRHQCIGTGTTTSGAQEAIVAAWWR